MNVNKLLITYHMLENTGNIVEVILCISLYTELNTIKMSTNIFSDKKKHKKTI